MSILAVPFIVSAFIAGMFLTSAPYASDAFKKWFQVKFMCPTPGDLGIFVQPSGPEAIILMARKVILQQQDEVPVNSIVLVVSYANEEEAVCNWNNKIAVLPRRWIRKIK